MKFLLHPCWSCLLVFKTDRYWMLNILVTIIYLFGDSAWWPWHLSSTKNVDMKMINWLGSIPSIIDDWKQTEKASQILDGAGGGGLCHHVFPNPTCNFQFILVINPLSTKIHIYILQTGLHTFPQRISWENMMKDLSIFFVVFILLIYYSHNLFSWIDVWILLVYESIVLMLVTVYWCTCA